MPTGRICHTHCPSGGGWGWLWYVAAAIAAAIGCYFAVKAALAWLAGHVVFDVLAGWLLVLAGFGVAYKARVRSRRGRPIPPAPISRVPRAPEAARGRLSVPQPRDGGR